MCATGWPLERTSSTASRLNSGVNLRLVRLFSPTGTSSHLRCPALGGKSSCRGSGPKAGHGQLGLVEQRQWRRNDLSVRGCVAHDQDLQESSEFVLPEHPLTTAPAHLDHSHFRTAQIRRSYRRITRHPALCAFSVTLDYGSIGPIMR